MPVGCRTRRISSSRGREEAEVVVELVAVGGLGEQLGRVAAAAEARAVAVRGAPVVTSVRRVCVRPVLNGGSA